MDAVLKIYDAIKMLVMSNMNFRHGVRETFVEQFRAY